LYRYRIFKTSRLSAKVISIGNITVGGTGKTPLVEKLARLLHDKGCRVGIVSRGYRNKGSGIIVVSDGEKLSVTPQTAGDEPFLLARHMKGMPVVASEDRVQAGQYAIDNFKCDVILLDDCFQHLKLERDADLVVIDSANPWGNGKLIPAGPLRESLKSLRRADALIFTRVDQARDIEELKNQTEQYSDAPVLTSVHRSVEWISLETHNRFSLDFVEHKRILGFAGIGNPESFQKTLLTFNVRIADFMTYRDHHWYTDKDLQRIARTAERQKAEAIVTTEKDSVRLPAHYKNKIPMYYLKIELAFTEGFEKLWAILDRILAREARGINQ
jgi:tetraacyldisaccharide 4'-kinase